MENIKELVQEQVKETDYMTDEEYYEMYGEDDEAVEIMSIEEAIEAGLIMEDPDLPLEEIIKLGNEIEEELIKKDEI